MSDEPRLFEATYHTSKFVLGRGVMQVTFEVPIERALEIQEKLGVPKPGAEKWFAICGLNTNAT